MQYGRADSARRRRTSTVPSSSRGLNTTRLAHPEYPLQIAASLAEIGFSQVHNLRSRQHGPSHRHELAGLKRKICAFTKLRLSTFFRLTSIYNASLFDCEIWIAEDPAAPVISDRARPLWLIPSSIEITVRYNSATFQAANA